MTTLDPALDAALSADCLVPFGAIEIIMPNYVLRLVDGAGEVVFNERRFYGLDATYGVLGSVTAFADGVNGEAPAITVTLLPPSNTAVAALAAPALQGAQVSIWVGALELGTATVQGEPDLRFFGQVDVPTLKIPGQAGAPRTLELKIASAWDLMFADDEGVRLCDAWQQSIWPGDVSLQAVTSVLRHLPWGSDAPRPAVSTSGSAGTSASGGGGYGGGINVGSILPF